MFSVNGQPLDDPELGWLVRGESTAISDIEVDLQSLRIPGADGVVEGMPAPVQPPIIPLQIETPRTNAGRLRALFAQRPLILTEEEQDGIEARVERAGISRQEGYGPADEVIVVGVLLRIPGVYWRDSVEDTTDPVTLGADAVDLDLYAGGTGPVRDSIVRLKGNFSNLRLEGQQETFIEYNAAVTGGNYLRIDTATGRAWVTATDVWTGGTEVSGDIETGPLPYRLSLEPDPVTLESTLTVRTTTRTSSPTVEVRGRRAYSV